MAAKTFRAWMAIAFGATVCEAHAANLTVVSHVPARHVNNVPMGSKISITFDRAVLPSSVTPLSFSAFGRWSGAVLGSFTFSNGDTTVTLSPQKRFSSGEPVMVVLSHDLMAADGSPMRAAGYSYVFTTRVRPSPMTFTLHQSMSNRTVPEINTRIYGAAGGDFDEDGHLDLATVNEDSADVRVFLNAADAQGTYDPWLQPPFDISFEASPNEPADFNRDGKTDLCAAASGTSTVWVLLGNGDGTFQPPGQEIAVGGIPHGIAVLDADGDGDIDIATANTGSNNLSLLLNDGNGVFGNETQFDSNGDFEYGLGAADMNHDGIMDLAVGAIVSQAVIVMRGNGNGTFTPQTPFNAGGAVWQIACGDVNNDGNMDVSCANSGSDNGSILLGNGNNGFGAPSTVSAASHVVATDLGDLDGDGDLDWVLSSFGGGRWTVFSNNGAGVFSFVREFVAPSNPSCAIMLDVDNDRDLDLALSDEIADIVQIQKNGSSRPMGDFNGDDSVAAADYTAFAGCFTGPGGSTAASCHAGDFDGDGDVDCTDWTAFENAWTGPGTLPEFATCAPPIPAVGEWGLLALALTTLCGGSLVLRARGYRPDAAEGSSRPT